MFNYKQQPRGLFVCLPKLPGLCSRMSIRGCNAKPNKLEMCERSVGQGGHFLRLNARVGQRRAFKGHSCTLLTLHTGSRQSH
jgi:hypothetical protein